MSQMYFASPPARWATAWLAALPPRVTTQVGAVHQAVRGDPYKPLYPCSIGECGQWGPAAPPALHTLHWAVHPHLDVAIGPHCPVGPIQPSIRTLDGSSTKIEKVMVRPNWLSRCLFVVSTHIDWMFLLFLFVFNCVLMGCVMCVCAGLWLAWVTVFLILWKSEGVAFPCPWNSFMVFGWPHLAERQMTTFTSSL